MGKYSKLGVFLQNGIIDSVKLTYKEIENILGFNLPKSARQYNAWWANNGDSHTHAVDGWLASGWKAKVDLDNQVVIFTRTENMEKVQGTKIKPSSNTDTKPADFEEIAQNSMSTYYSVSLSSEKHPNIPKLSNMISDELDVTFKAVEELNVKKNILISCVSKKLDHRAKAKDLYVSTLFKYNLQYAISVGADRIFILSAKYGLLNLEDEIDPYDQTLNTMRTAEIKKWAKDVLSQLNIVTDIKNDTFVFLAGDNYRKYLLPYISNYEIPLEGMKIGEQLQYLKEHVNNK